jgi:hypothetical protein
MGGLRPLVFTHHEGFGRPSAAEAALDSQQPGRADSVGYAYQWLHRPGRCNGTSNLSCFCFVSVFSFGIMAKGCHHW